MNELSHVRPVASLRPKDFASKQDVRWCPGCGDYAILKAVQKTCADLKLRTDHTVFVSGIGCAARFPYYMSTYGFHTIHGRAAPVATGIKLANPDLDVWVVSGDGDSLSIGGNHLLHLLRRNVNLVYLLFNNEIYGLTKGQYSPTSRTGTHSPSSPDGSIERPVDAVAFALGAGARFIARSIDIAQSHLIDTLKQAHTFPGTGFVEILQNCIVYNDAVFAEVSDKASAADHQLLLRHGEPMVYGRDRDKALRLNTRNLALETVNLGDPGVEERDVLVHDETSPVIAALVGALRPPNFPVALGVLYRAPALAFDQQRAEHRRGPATIEALQRLMRSGPTWTV